MASLPTNRTVANTPNEHVADHNVLHATHNLIDASGLDATDLAALNTLVATLGAWTSYTPTLTQPGAVTKTVTYARWTRIGRLVVAQAKLTVTGTGTAANAVRVGLPVAASTTSDVAMGTGWIFDSSAAAVYRAVVVPAAATEVFLSPANSTVADVLGITTFSAALAAGDTVIIGATYEAAS